MMMMTMIVLQSFVNLFCSIHQLYFVKPGVFIDKEESEENTKWTDRALMLEYGRIDRIEIEEPEDGWWIQRIRARCFPSPSPILPPRYGTDQHHQWSPWRETGKQESRPRFQQLELNSGHQLSGYHRYSSGELRSICVRNLDTGEQQALGDHTFINDFNSLIVGPPIAVESIIRLSHLSGDEESYNWSICFNFS